MAEPDARIRLPQRTTRGKRLRAQIQAEEEQADNEFWNQDFFAEDAKDIDYVSEKEEEDVPDSDFFESESEDDDDEEADVREKPRKKALKPPGAPPSRPRPTKPPAAKVAKTPASASPSQAAAGGEAPSDALPQSVIFEAIYEAPTLRKSTRERVEVAQKEREHRDQLARSVRRPQKQGDYRVLTQEELLAEAARTELENLASLKQLLAQEEETKRKANVKKQRFGGPLVKFKSRAIEVLQLPEHPASQTAAATAAAAAAAYGLGAAMTAISSGWGIGPAVAASGGMDAAAAAAATTAAAASGLGSTSVADAGAGQCAVAAANAPNATLSAVKQPATAAAAPGEAAHSAAGLPTAGLQQPQPSTPAEPTADAPAAMQQAIPPATAVPDLSPASEPATSAAGDSNPVVELAADAPAAVAQDTTPMSAVGAGAAPSTADAAAPPASLTAVVPPAPPAAGGNSATAPTEQATAASAEAAAPAAVQAAATDRPASPAGPVMVRQLLNTLQCFGMKAPKWLQPQRAPPPPAKPICAITGVPARYKDPFTGHYYSSVAALRELRRRLGGPIPEAAPRRTAAVGSQPLLQPLPGSLDNAAASAGSTAADGGASSVMGFPPGELQLQQLVLQQVQQHQALGSSHKTRAGRGSSHMCYQQQQPAMPDEVAALVVGVSQMVHGAA